MVDLAPLDVRTFSRVLPDDYPHFCPVCGRSLIYMWWDTVGGGSRYESFVCFGNRGRLYQWLAMRVRTTWPSGLHYRYDFGPSSNDDRYVRLFDPQTGKRLR
jgi:hypothetical protein